MDHDRFTCVPIIGARTTDQLNENYDAIDVSLSDDQWERIDEAGEA
jgi:aryl-alcohol dehydrogenase-like predicted oxidoreductase